MSLIIWLYIQFSTFVNGTIRLVYDTICACVHKIIVMRCVQGAIVRQKSRIMQQLSRSPGQKSQIRDNPRKCRIVGSMLYIAHSWIHVHVHIHIHVHVRSLHCDTANVHCTHPLHLSDDYQKQQTWFYIILTCFLQYPAL